MLFIHTVLRFQLPYYSDDEAIATRSAMYGGPGQVGAMMPSQAGPGHIPMMASQFNDQYANHQVDPPVDGDVDMSMNHHQYGNDGNSSITSALMGGAQNRLKKKRMNKM
jgi:hypothetical protein